jgi:hypothetical protein
MISPTLGALEAVMTEHITRRDWIDRLRERKALGLMPRHQCAGCLRWILFGLEPWVALR